MATNENFNHLLTNLVNINDDALERAFHEAKEMANYLDETGDNNNNSDSA